MAYLFRFDGTAWVREQRLTAADGTLLAHFGSSVSVSEGIAVVGAYNHLCVFRPFPAYCGSAYVYRFDGTSWVEEQKLVPAETHTLRRFGYSVSLSGDTALIGVPQSDCAAGIQCGSAHIFQFNGNSWVEQKLTASDADVYDFFGFDVSVSGNTAVVGADGDDCAGDDRCGSAYIFRFNGSSWVEDQKITAADAGPTDSFGVAVAISGQTVVVGALNDCSTGLQCGAAYVFDCPNCGDGHTGSGEECDGGLACTDCLCDAGFEPTDPLSMNCQLICGNGGIDPNEECDDGNTASGDGCSENCIIEFGACCAGTACDITTQAGCENAAGNFLGFNTACDTPDGDGDGLRDECDACAADPNKIEPGICGCGRDDVSDSDNDGVTDCLDQCRGVDDSIFAPECAEAIPAVSAWGLIVLTLLLLTGIKLNRRREITIER